MAWLLGGGGMDIKGNLHPVTAFKVTLPPHGRVQLTPPSVVKGYAAPVP